MMGVSNSTSQIQRIYSFQPICLPMFTPQFVNNLTVQTWQMSCWMWYRTHVGGGGGCSSLTHVGVVISHPFWWDVMSDPGGGLSCLTHIGAMWCLTQFGGGKCCLIHVRGGEILNAPLLIHLNSSGLSIYYLATKTHTFHENNVELGPPGEILDLPLNRNNYFNILLFKNKSNEIGKQSSIKFQGLPHINWLKCSKQSAYYRVNLCATAFPLCRACPGTLPRSCRTKLVIMPKVSSH